MSKYIVIKILISSFRKSIHNGVVLILGAFSSFPVDIWGRYDWEKSSGGVGKRRRSSGKAQAAGIHNQLDWWPPEDFEVGRWQDSYQMSPWVMTLKTSLNVLGYPQSFRDTSLTARGSCAHSRKELSDPWLSATIKQFNYWALSGPWVWLNKIGKPNCILFCCHISKSKWGQVYRSVLAWRWSI